MAACPACSHPGALIVGNKVLCLSKRCRWYDPDSHKQWRAALARGDDEFSGDPSADVMRHEWELIRSEREAADRARREGRIDD